MPIRMPSWFANRRVRCAATVLCCILAATPAGAGIGRWTPVGPEAPGIVMTLAIDPQTPTTLYAGTQESGVFKSTDGGATWHPRSRGLEGYASIRVILIDPHAPSTLYLDYRNSKSTDGGETWIQNPFSGGGGPTAIDPQQPSTLYAARDFLGGAKSTDGGATWNEIGGNLGTIASIVVDPRDSAIVFASVAERGLFKSIDGAATWTAANDGLSSRSVGAPTIDPVTPAVMYVSAFPDYDYDWNVIAPGGVFKSVDGGVTWTPSGAGLGDRIPGMIVIDPRDTTTLYAAAYGGEIFKSTDAGATWQDQSPTSAPFEHVYALVIDPLSGALYLGTDQGVAKSTDGGATWNAVNAGFTMLDARAVAVAATDPPTVYVGSYRDGVFASTDRGVTWNRANTGLGSGFSVEVESFVVDPQTPTTLYASIGSPHYRVFKSTDGGGSWDAFPTSSFAVFCIAKVAVDPFDSARLYAGLERGGTCGGGVLLSTDGGSTWTPTDAPEIKVSAIALDPVTPDTVYIGSYYPGGVFKSTDGGATWAASDVPASAYVTAIAIDPLHPATVYAATMDGVLRSTDGGTHFSLTSPHGGFRGTLVIDPRDPDVVYLGEYGVQRSVDRGATWTYILDGLTNPYLYDLAFDPTNPSELYVASSRNSAFHIDLGEPCAADPECDDRDPCTVDTCEESPTDVGQRCVRRPRSGFEGAACGFAVTLDEPPCAGEPMRLRFERVLARGAARLARVSAVDSPVRTARLLKAAAELARRGRKVVNQLSERGRMNPACGAAVADALEAAESRARRLANRL